MGFGQGGVQRVKSVKINRAQLKNRKRKGDFNPDIKKIAFLDHKKMSPAQFSVYKEGVKKREADSQKRLLITFGIVVVLFGTVVYYFLYS